MNGIPLHYRFLKRLFDISVALIGLILSLWLFLILFTLASLSTKSNGFFTQKRVGKNGKTFSIIKFKTMIAAPSGATTVTTTNNPRITRTGAFLRRFKLDELPQLVNIIAGDMSFVGPRPDVPGYADKLEGEDRAILTIRPGITGPASLEFRNEEETLAEVEDPEKYNLEVIWPKKVKINRAYIEQYTFAKDIIYILKTIFPNDRGA